MSSSDFVASIIVLIVFGGIIFCCVACCVGLKQMCRKKYPPVYHTATYATESTYSPNSRPFATNVSSPIMESSLSSQTRLQQHQPTAPIQNTTLTQPMIPYPRYNPSVMQDFFRERTSSDPYARMQNQPEVHQWTPRPLSLQNFNHAQLNGYYGYPYQVQNSHQPINSVGFCQQPAVSVDSIGWNNDGPPSYNNAATSLPIGFRNI